MATLYMATAVACSLQRHKYAKFLISSLHEYNISLLWGRRFVIIAARLICTSFEIHSIVSINVSPFAEQSKKAS